jgi:hypothetical protein
MRHLRFSYAVLAICAALLVYGLVEGTSRTSALFVGEREATGEVDAGVAFPMTASATAETSATVEPTRAPGTQVAGATEESPTEEPEGTVAAATADPDVTPSVVPLTATRAPRTLGPTTGTATPDACDGAASLRLDGDTSYEGPGPFEIVITLSNSGGGAATGVVLAYSVEDGAEYLDEGVFDNGQLWWPHGLEGAGVIYAAGDIGLGGAENIDLVMSMNPEFGGGAHATITVAIIEGECVEGEVEELEIALTAPADETATPAETPVVDGTGTPDADRTSAASTTPDADETPDVTGTPTIDETPDMDETPGTTETAEPTATNTAVPTSTSTPVPTSTSTPTATPDGAETLQEEDPELSVLGEQATPAASATPTPLPLGRVLPGTGEGYRLPGGASAELYIGVALLVIFLGGAAVAGRRLG